MDKKTNPIYSAEMFPTDPDVLVKVEGTCKKFCRDLKKSLWYGAQDIANELTPWTRNAERHANLRPEEFWAVNNVSFELRRGECLGLIGRNGAGKTTLLKMLNGLIKPDKGRIEMRGRVGALIALGSGFNPILTGRENIYVNASVLGLSKKQIDNKVEEIIDFAEIEEFISSPVQTYSSGMKVRLGFAVATALEPDILLLDEVLAVGDLKFRVKCYNKIDEMRKKASVIFVSHSIEHIGRICNSTLVLNKGKTIYYGNVSNGLETYSRQSDSIDHKPFKKNFPPIKSIILSTNKIKYNYGEEVILLVEIDTNEEIFINFRFVIFEYPSRIVAGEINSIGLGLPNITIKKGSQKLIMKIPALNLKAGKYTIAHNFFSLGNHLISVGEAKNTIQVKGSGIGETHNQIPIVSCN